MLSNNHENKWTLTWASFLGVLYTTAPGASVFTVTLVLLCTCRSITQSFPTYPEERVTILGILTVSRLLASLKYKNAKSVSTMIWSRMVQQERRLRQQSKLNITVFKMYICNNLQIIRFDCLESTICCLGYGRIILSKFGTTVHSSKIIGPGYHH